MDEDTERECPYCGLEHEWRVGLVTHDTYKHYKAVDIFGTQTAAVLLQKMADGNWHAVTGRESDMRVREDHGHTAEECLKYGCGHTSLHNYYKIYERAGFAE